MTPLSSSAGPSGSSSPTGSGTGSALSGRNSSLSGSAGTSDAGFGRGRETESGDALSDGSSGEEWAAAIRSAPPRKVPASVRTIRSRLRSAERRRETADSANTRAAIPAVAQGNAMRSQVRAGRMREEGGASGSGSVGTGSSASGSGESEFSGADSSSGGASRGSVSAGSGTAGSPSGSAGTVSGSGPGRRAAGTFGSGSVMAAPVHASVLHQTMRRRRRS